MVASPSDELFRRSAAEALGPWAKVPVAGIKPEKAEAHYDWLLS